MPMISGGAAGRGVARRAPLLWALAALAVLAAALVALRTWRPRRDWVDLPPAVAAQVKNVHAHEGHPVCGACHLTRDRRLKADPVVLCSACHQFTHRNHPVNVAIGKRARAPRDVPLWVGRVACHTCHDPHDGKAALRLPFDDLCKQCHRR
jgi:predicted CXXCH cytochrome family protein